MGQRRTFTTIDVARIIGAPAGSQRARDVVALLRRHGWIRPLPMRGTYEFESASGGPFPSGDPWLELRVALERDPLARAHVGLGSAAFARRLADRRPLPDTVVWADDRPAPKGLSSVYRVIRCTTHRFFGSSMIDSVSVATPERIAMEVAMWWRDAGDLRNPEHWISDVLSHIDIETLTVGARQLGPTVTARLGYIANAFGAHDVADSLVKLPLAGPVWIGPRFDNKKIYDSTWGVYDTLGVAGVE